MKELIWFRVYGTCNKCNRHEDDVAGNAEDARHFLHLSHARHGHLFDGAIEQKEFYAGRNPHKPLLREVKKTA